MGVVGSQHPAIRANSNNLRQLFRGGRRIFKTSARMFRTMTRILIIAVAIIVAGAAQAAAPEFDMDHFCGDFAKNRQGGDLGGMAKAVCLISEESTKTLVDKAWDHVSAQNKETCLKAAGQSYVGLATCLSSVQAH